MKKRQLMIIKMLSFLGIFFLFIGLVLAVFDKVSYAYKTDFASLDELLETGNKVYVQHDENNNDIYDLQKEDDITTIYEVILAKFKANKAWTREGNYIDNISTTPHGATAPDDYIKVTSGEKYFIKTYGVGYTSGTWYAPVLYLDDNDEVIGTDLMNTLSKSKSGVVITVPEGATKMHLTMFNNQNFTLQRILNVTSEKFDELTKNQNKEKILSFIEDKYKEYQDDKTVYKKLDKSYITFVHDDTTSAIDTFADLFIEKEIPFCLATVPELLIENSSSQKESRLETVRRVVEHGGEVLAHNGDTITAENVKDYNILYKNFVRTKQMFNHYGFDVNGIILAGGTGLIKNSPETEKWASSVYSYSDLYGVEYDTKAKALDSVYYHPRGSFLYYNNNVEAIKSAIDNAIKNKEWVVLYFHNTNEVSLETLEAVLDYVNSKSYDEIEATNYRDMYLKYAAKESDIIEKQEPITVTFTIDDSYKGALTHVKPYFDKYGFKASVGVIRDLVLQSTEGKNNWYLTEDDVKTLYNSGWEILSHGLDLSNTNDGNSLFTQPSSNNALSQSGYTIKQEIVDSKTYLENLLGKGTIKGFAIPNLYISDEYTKLLETNYNYAIGSGSSNSDYAHKRTKLSNMMNIANQTSEEAKTIADNMIKQIDSAIANGNELNIYFHISDGFIKEISWNHYDCNLESLDIVLAYLKEKQDKGLLNVKLPSEVYAVEKVIEEKKTYYISADGNSSEGLSIDDPMSLNTALEKTYTSGDTILFKSGDNFFGMLDFKINQIDDSITTISRYGSGELPTINGYKLVNKETAWELYQTGIYRVDLTNTDNFSGLQIVDAYRSNIGFMEDIKGNKYYNRKTSLADLKNEYDFYCDNSYLYIKINENPYLKLGSLKLAPRMNLMVLESKIVIDGIHFNYSGGHGLVNGIGKTIEDVTIKNCIIENIGGSILKDTTRYGNGIEFYEIDTKNIEIKDNIIRNIYDTAFTIQGSKGSGDNVNIYNNVFVNNTQDSEIWENGSATGVTNYHYHDNLSINQGRGWGYEARPDKYVAAHILFWGYLIENTDINFYNNTVYNPRRIYFAEQSYGTNIFFKETDKIKSYNNYYLLGKDAKIFREEYNYSTVEEFKGEYKKDNDSTFKLITVDDNISNIASISNDIIEIRNLFEEERIIESITLNGITDGIEIIKGSKFDYSNLTLTVKYSDNKSVIVKVTDEMIGTINTNIVGKQTITITYQGKNVSFTLNVVEKKDELAPNPTSKPEPSPSVTPIPSPSVIPTPSPSVTPTPSPSVTPTPSPSVTPTPSPSATPTPSPSVTPTPSPSATPTPSQSVTPSTTNPSNSPSIKHDDKIEIKNTNTIHQISLPLIFTVLFSISIVIILIVVVKKYYK